MASAPDATDLEQRIVAAERLLSTLIALLAARDPRILRELQAVFSDAGFAADPAGKAASETWRRIAVELESTGRLVDSLTNGSVS